MPSSETPNASHRVNIRPGVGILSVLRHLKYKPWFAMAEFVDNSLQSYFLHRDALQRLHGDEFRLRVEIELDRSDEMRIKVRDNAAGIASSEYARAFRAAELPPETTGSGGVWHGHEERRVLVCSAMESSHVRRSASR